MTMLGWITLLFFFAATLTLLNWKRGAVFSGILSSQRSSLHTWILVLVEICTCTLFLSTCSEQALHPRFALFLCLFGLALSFLILVANIECRVNICKTNAFLSVRTLLLLIRRVLWVHSDVMWIDGIKAWSRGRFVLMRLFYFIFLPVVSVASGNSCCSSWQVW
jgi:hypothetical protein